MVHGYSLLQLPNTLCPLCPEKHGLRQILHSNTQVQQVLHSTTDTVPVCSAFAHAAVLHWLAPVSLQSILHDAADKCVYCLCRLNNRLIRNHKYRMNLHFQNFGKVAHCDTETHERQSHLEWLR